MRTELVRAKEALNTTQILCQAAQETADAAAQVLKRSKTVMEQAKERHLQPMQQHVAHLIKTTTDQNVQETGCMAAYLQDTVKDTQDHL